MKQLSASFSFKLKTLAARCGCTHLFSDLLLLSASTEREALPREAQAQNTSYVTGISIPAHSHPFTLIRRG
ncbi:MAG: hypothetical protein LAT84_00320 [Balneolia bacterium]|nr:hypothetical protein [Balneolia bacterium]